MKPLFIGVLPNFHKEEYNLARKLFWSGKSYEGSKDEFVKKLAHVFYPEVKEEDILAGAGLGTAIVYGKANLYLMDSARSSFFFALQNLNLPEGSEVLLPSFTCVVLVNPVLWNKLTPIYVDIDKQTFNTPIKELLAAVTDKTKVILAQHTFGNVIDVEELRKGLKKIGREDIFIIEDLAHSLGGHYPLRESEKSQKGVQIGTIVFKSDEPAPVAAEEKDQKFRLGIKADMAIMTFGVEKSFSTIRGGAILINQNERTEGLAQVFDIAYKKLPELPKSYLRKLLFNPVFWESIFPIYNLGFGKFTLGKLLVYIAHKFNILGIEIDDEEYGGGQPDYLPAKLPGKLAEIGKMQVEKLPQFNSHRREIAKKYSKIIAETSLKDSPEQKEIKRIFDDKIPHNFLRYPLLLPSKKDRDALLIAARKEKVVLGDWYKTMFYTDPQFLKTLKYTKGDCPVAEDIMERIINLPTSKNVTPEHIAVIKRLLLDKFPSKN